MIYKFVTWDIPPLEQFAKTEMYLLHEKLVNEEPLTREEKDRLYFPAFEPVYKRAGWAYDYREFLKTFYVESKHGNICKVYAWDRTAIRKHFYEPIVNIADA